MKEKPCVELADYGEVLFENYPSVIVGRKILPEIQIKLVEIYGQSVLPYFYSAAKNEAYDVVKEVAESLTGALERLNQKALTNELLKQFPQRGFGEATLVSFDKTTSAFTVRVHNCFNSKNISNPNHVCAIVAGFLAGGAYVVTKKDMDATETKCTARGDAYCEFEVKPSTKWMQNV